MLDRAKVAQQLMSAADGIFKDISPALNQASELWQTICADPTFIYKVREHQALWRLPLWYGELGQHDASAPCNGGYTVFSVDGSQIYPDRHQGVRCSLINIGEVTLSYGNVSCPVVFNSHPYVLDQLERVEGFDTVEYINAYREELELVHGMNLASQSHTIDTPTLLLFDGSLVFWHLESKSADRREPFLSRYIAALQTLYEKRIPALWYISLPKSKDIINLLKAQCCDFDESKKDRVADIDQLVDTHIVQTYLQPCQRTTIFNSVSSISRAYPPHLAPHFFYVHVGSEIARIEVPYWLTHDAVLLDSLTSLVIDQATKGNGYPIAIAEAHEHAVVKSADREFFYRMIESIGFKRDRRINGSLKSAKKRRMNV